MKITTLVGNPTVGSRTRASAEAFTRAVMQRMGLSDADHQVIDIARHATALFDMNDASIQAWTARVAASDLVIVASPTYKATYTGILKAFFDRYPTDGLGGVVAIPYMTGGTPRHAMGADVSLRPLLNEMNASVPTRSLFVLTAELESLDQTIKLWLDANEQTLRRALQPTSA